MLTKYKFLKIVLKYSVESGLIIYILNNNITPHMCCNAISVILFLHTWPPGAIPIDSGQQCLGSPSTGRSTSGGSALCFVRSHQSPGCLLYKGTHLGSQNSRKELLIRTTVKISEKKHSYVGELGPHHLYYCDHFVPTHTVLYSQGNVTLCVTKKWPLIE